MGRTESLNLKNDYERACGWYGHFNKSEMALFSECTDRYAQNMLDTADIVREAIFRQTREKEAARSVAQIWVNCHSPALQQPFRDVASIFVALAPVLQLE